jgi:hypothetical protein
VVLIVCITVSSIVSTWIRARYGYSDRDGRRGPRHSRQTLEDLVDEAMAERDATISALEERIRVLERIVTDRSYRLKDEIDRLAG